MYCRPLILVLLLLVAMLPGTAQEAFKEGIPNTMTVFDANGKVFENPDSDITGSPYFIDAWKYGTIVLNNNLICSKRLLRLDCQRQEIHYLSERHVEMSLAASYVKELVFIDSSVLPAITYRFQSGFPPIDNQNGQYLYRVLTDGALKLLEANTKRVVTDKNDFSGETNKEYRLYNSYYFFSGVSITRIKNDKAFVLGLMAKQKDKIEEYAKLNKLNYKSAEDLKKITEYYNSLQ